MYFNPTDEQLLDEDRPGFFGLGVRTTAKQRARNFFKGVVVNIGDAIKRKAKETVDSAVFYVLDTPNRIGRSIKRGVDNTVEEIKATPRRVAEATTKAVEEAVEEIAATPGKIADATVAAVDSKVKETTEAISATVDATLAAPKQVIGSVAESVTELLPEGPSEEEVEESKRVAAEKESARQAAQEARTAERIRNLEAKEEAKQEAMREKEEARREKEERKQAMEQEKQEAQRAKREKVRHGDTHGILTSLSLTHFAICFAHRRLRLQKPLALSLPRLRRHHHRIKLHPHREGSLSLNSEANPRLFRSPPRARHRSRQNSSLARYYPRQRRHRMPRRPGRLCHPCLCST